VHDVIPHLTGGTIEASRPDSTIASWRGTCRAAYSIITVSEHAKRDIVRVLDAREECVHVTYEAVEARFADQPARTLNELEPSLRLPERFALYIWAA